MSVDAGHSATNNPHRVACVEALDISARALDMSARALDMSARALDMSARALGKLLHRPFRRVARAASHVT